MATSENSPPYVVSADSRGLLTSWANTQQLTVPGPDYFQGMLGDLEGTLRQYFDTVDIVPEDFLRAGLNGFVQRSTMPVWSLDRVYIDPKQANLVGFLDPTRTVDSALKGLGLGDRRSDVTLEQQIRQLAAAQPGQPVDLLDDVIFEGNTMLGLVEKMRQAGIIVDTIYSGITISDGKKLLEEHGIRVESLLEYSSVIDEICERDFVVGTPLSGRSVVNGKGVVEGAPYMYPFGKPTEWASIPPDSALDFSLFCLSQALGLWKSAERLSGQAIPTQLFAKPVFGLRDSGSVSRSIEIAIQQIKEGQ